MMGIGPTYAIPIALERAGITKDDVDLFEASNDTAKNVSARGELNLRMSVYIDQRGVCVYACLLRQEAGIGSREGEREWWCDRAGTSAR